MLDEPRPPLDIGHDGLHAPQPLPRGRRRLLALCALSMGVAVAATLVAQALTLLIALITNASFYGRLSTATVSPAGNTLGFAVVLVPIAGSVVVGLMARYGSKAIRGHGIPEAMEQVLFNESRIPPRMTLLKPLSAAIAIGTGGPFGAEGPIIATGSGLGSLLGQLLHITPDERKTLLAAGAAAGMSATFGTPVAAVLLAIELLLFEYRARSIVPVALATSVAAALRVAFVGAEPVFAMSDLVAPSGGAEAFYVLVGALAGVAAVVITRALYAIEDAFERLPIHWMWWPALGAIVVGVVGWLEPKTLGVGYSNIEDILTGRLAGFAVVALCTAKLVSWIVSLASGTSGGTLAPLFTIGGGLGAALGAGFAWLVPSAGIDPRIAALVGMAAMFAGASRALLASVVFAFETTRQPLGLLPLLGGCTAAYLVSHLGMRTSIMTEKLVRRGTPVPSDLEADHLAQQLVRDHASGAPVTLSADATVTSALAHVAAGGAAAPFHGFPVVDDARHLIGVITRRDLLEGAATEGATLRGLVRRAPVVVFDDNTLREAADHMVREGVGHLPVVTRVAPRIAVGMLTRTDLLAAHTTRLDRAHRRGRVADRWQRRDGAND